MQRRLATLAGVALAAACGCGGVTRVGSALPGPAGDRRVDLHVEAPRNVAIVARPAAGPATVLCRGRCDVRAEVDVAYRAEVPDLPDSPAFALAPDRASTVIAVRPAPKVLPGLGGAIGTIGGGAMLAGGAVAAGDWLGSSDLAGAAPSGLITAAIGSAALAAGVVLAALSGTRVDIERGVELDASGRGAGLGIRF